MNERIKEKLPNPFRAQGRQISYDGDDKSFCDLYNKEQMIEFAELIVRECAKICADTAVADPLNDLLEGYNTGVNKAAENIKQHFGVEE